MISFGCQAAGQQLKVEASSIVVFMKVFFPLLFNQADAPLPNGFHPLVNFDEFCDQLDHLVTQYARARTRCSEGAKLFSLHKVGEDCWGGQHWSTRFRRTSLWIRRPVCETVLKDRFWQTGLRREGRPVRRPWVAIFWAWDHSRYRLSEPEDIGPHNLVQPGPIQNTRDYSPESRCQGSIDDNSYQIELRLQDLDTEHQRNRLEISNKTPWPRLF